MSSRCLTILSPVHQSCPKFSIVIPAYREKALLSRAVISVLVQTISDFEVLVSDDSNSADIQAVIQSFGDSRIHYVGRQSPSGAIDNWNSCLEGVRGEYAILMHHDESFAHACCLAEIERSFKASGAHLVVSALWLEPAGGRIRRHGVPLLRWVIMHYAPFLFLVYNPIGPVSVLAMRRECARVRFDRSYRWLVDLEYYSRLFAGRRVRFCAKSVVLSYLSHPHKITAQNSWEEIERKERKQALDGLRGGATRSSVIVLWKIYDLLRLILRSAHASRGLIVGPDTSTHE